jgi:hypothetical protein
MHFAWRCGFSLCLLAATIASTGCLAPHAGPYQYGRRDLYRTSTGLANLTGEQFEYGEARPVLDKVGWVMGIPGKIALWDRRVDNHAVSPETEDALAHYLAANELSDVKVRINQYAPRDEWRRLVRNDSVGAGWRYTLGTVSWLGYTVFPGRVFGGNNFNPYTNTINIYGDVPALAVHEGGHAKDFAQRTHKGTYAAVYALVPGAPLYHEAVATRDTLAFVHEHGTYTEEQEAYRKLYPAYGTYVGGAIGDLSLAPAGIAWGVGALGGHLIGHYKSRQVPEFNSQHASAPEAIDWDPPIQNNAPATPLP